MISINIIYDIYLYSNLALIGLIWTVQLVHYPSFLFVEKSRFFEFQDHHMKKITFVVMPLMLIELFCGAILLYQNYNNLLFLTSFLCLAFIWAWTFFVNVPLHSKLLLKHDDELIHALIKSNWPRTILWSFKLIWVMLDMRKF
jgi:hypothetical protein